MPWDFADDRPIYLQLIERFGQKIISGEWAPGDRLPSVRELAAEAAVNPNTMQKALTELEREGLVYAQRTSGRYITEDAELIRGLRLKTAEREAEVFLTKIAALGFAPEEIIALLQSQIANRGQ